MIPNYVPIIRAMEGEFSAFENLADREHNKILPLFELPTLPSKLPKWLSDSTTPTELLISRRVNQIAQSRKGKSILFDISRWQTDSTTESGSHILSYSFDQLIRNEIDAIPVIGYDRWEDISYSNALISLDNKNQKYCIRLEAYAFEDMIEVDHFLEVLNDIINKLSIDTSKCNVILDLGDVTSTSIEDIQEKITEAIDIINDYNFSFISIAGCSLTMTIDKMVKEHDSSDMVLRRELVAWKAIKTNHKSLIFGDYGIVPPNMAENIIAPDANGKIRYTVNNNYLIARGHSRRKGNKGEQMWNLSQEIVNSIHYMGDTFSWGDRRIFDCSNQELKGNPSQWVAIDTNHHMNAVIHEIFEFEKTLTVPTLFAEVSDTFFQE